MQRTAIRELLMPELAKLNTGIARNTEMIIILNNRMQVELTGGFTE
jgi:hypothetical protein